MNGESQSDSPTHRAAEIDCTFSLSQAANSDCQEDVDIDFGTCPHPGPDEDDVMPSDFLMFASTIGDQYSVAPEPRAYEEKNGSAVDGASPDASTSNACDVAPMQSAAASLKARYQAFGNACLASISHAESASVALGSYRDGWSSAKHTKSRNNNSMNHRRRDYKAKRERGPSATFGTMYPYGEFDGNSQAHSESSCYYDSNLDVGAWSRNAHASFQTYGSSQGTSVNTTHRYACLSTDPSCVRQEPR
eukprot:TRINITY_DN24288_c0_g1_i1.p1 TRINITY_DN24288_c0_g1~~TRINITY_DN24288_c0_g1_i1.p1  ORF type:complete len:248 (-),score=25.51 TRINITY_DN24288_c0_g1_i1:254-997(-)